MVGAAAVTVATFVLSKEVVGSPVTAATFSIGNEMIGALDNEAYLALVRRWKEQ